MLRTKIICMLAVLSFIPCITASCTIKEPVGAAGTKPVNSDTASHPGNIGKRWVVGFSIASFQEERWLIDRDIFVAKCKELGADVIVQSANGDENLQASQCEKMLSQGIDALVIIPQDCDKASSIADAANRMKVPVVAYDRLIRNCTLNAYITYDSEKIGELQAKSLTNKVPKGNYLLIGGAQTDYNSILIRQGQLKILKSYMDSGDIKIVDDRWTKDWNPSEARISVENSLEKSKVGIQAILAANDGIAGGVIQALAEKKLAGSVAVSGQDADLAGCQRIAEGTQTMTVYVPIKAEAEANAKAAIELAKGEKFSGNGSMFNGRMMVPSLLLAPISVDRDNLAGTVVKDGFQKLEDVFANIPKNKWPAQN